MVSKMIATTAVLMATAATTEAIAIPLQSQNPTTHNIAPRGIVGTTEHTGEDFLKFLTAHAHCANGNVCAITMHETCAWTKAELTNPVSTSSVIVQNQRGSEDAPTYIFDSQGKMLNLAQNNDQAIIALNEFKDNKIILGNAFPSGSNWKKSPTPCKMYGAGDDWNAIFKIGKTSTKPDGAEPFDTFCIDFTDIIAAENKKGNGCQAYIIQTAKMTTPLDSITKAAAEQTSEKIKGIDTELVSEITTHAISTCTRDKTPPAHSACKTNTTAMSSNKEFFACVDGYWYDNCLSLSSVASRVRSATSASNSAAAAGASGSSTGANSKDTQSSIKNTVSAVSATPIALIETYGGYKSSKKGFACGNSISSAVKQCAVKALKTALMNEAIFNSISTASILTKESLTPSQASKAQSLQYKTTSDQSKTHPDFLKALGKTGIHTAIMSGEAAGGNFAGCVIGALVANGACKAAEAKNDNEENKDDVDADTDADTDGTSEFDSLIGGKGGKVDFSFADLEFEGEDVNVDTIFNELNTYETKVLKVADKNAIDEHMNSIEDGSVKVQVGDKPAETLKERIEFNDAEMKNQINNDADLTKAISDQYNAEANAEQEKINDEKASEEAIEDISTEDVDIAIE